MTTKDGKRKKDERETECYPKTDATNFVVKDETEATTAERLDN